MKLKVLKFTYVELGSSTSEATKSEHNSRNIYKIPHNY